MKILNKQVKSPEKTVKQENEIKIQSELENELLQLAPEDGAFAD